MGDVGGERRRKGDAFFPPPSSFRALTPRGPCLLSSPSGSTPLPPPPPAATVLALPAARAPGAGFLRAPPRLAAGAMMDGGGEALLVRRSKGKKRPPPPPPPAEERESGGGNRFRALWRDYHDLLEEVEAKKRRLESRNRKKLRLLAEIKFLRRKYESFVKGDSHLANYKLKRLVRQNPSPVESNEDSAFADHGAGTEVPSTSKNTNLDLNQDSAMNAEGVDCRGYQGHPQPDKFDQVNVDEDMMTIDVKLSVCRDTGDSPASDDKRTIPWQDHLAPSPSVDVA